MFVFAIFSQIGRKINIIFVTIKKKVYFCRKICIFYEVEDFF